MKKTLRLFGIVLFMSLFMFSLIFADFANIDGPQLEFISNAIPMLWNKPTSDIAYIMSIFPDFECSVFEDQYVCSSKFNSNYENNIFINFFTDDYEEHHDNLWKVSITADVQSAEQIQSLFQVLWIDGLKPFHDPDDEFGFPGVAPLYFSREDTTMVAWLQPFTAKKGQFFLVEYYNGYMR